jgi:hypothetical protein
MKEAVKETPVKVFTYYKILHELYSNKYETLKNKIDILTNSIIVNKRVVNSNYIKANKKFHVKLENYKEFVNNEYYNGELEDVAKVLFDKSDEDTKVFCIALVKFATNIKLVAELNARCKLYKQIASLTRNDFTTLLKKYYNEVQRYILLEGYAYKLNETAGYLFVNKIRNSKKSRKVDFNKTNKRKAEVLAAGGEIYDKKKAEYFANHGLEYNGIDCRVYRDDPDFIYEFCNTYGKIHDVRFESSDSRNGELRNKSNEDLIKEANGDVNYILNLDLDIRQKMIILVQMDKTLDIKYKRNDNYETIKCSSPNR